jgi:hypothetical protein
MLRGFLGEEDGSHYLVLTSDDAGLGAFMSRRAEIVQHGGCFPAAHFLLTDPRLKGFGDVYLFDDLDAVEVANLVHDLGVSIASRVRALDAHLEMREVDFDPEDRRPMREVLGLAPREAAPQRSQSNAGDTTQDSFGDETQRPETGSLASDWYFAISHLSDNLMVRFALREQFLSEGTFPAVLIHANLIRAGLPYAWLREESANKFIANIHHDEHTLHGALTERGFVFNPNIWDAAPDIDVEPFIFEVDDVREVVRVAKLFRFPLVSFGNNRVTVAATHAGNLAEVLGRRQIAFQTSQDVPEPAPLDVLARRPFRAFYRLDVEGLGLEDTLAILTDFGINAEVSLLDWGETQHGVWLAHGIERLAERHRDILVMKAPDIRTDLYRADTNGRRIDAVVEERGETGPRPWTDGWAELTQERREHEIAMIEASEFFFTESRSGREALFFFVPAEVFTTGRGMWEGDLDPHLGKFLPQGFRVVEPGVYRATSSNFDLVDFDLHRAGFRESLDFRNWLNDQ